MKVILRAGIVKTPPEASFDPPALEDVGVIAKQPLRIALVDDQAMVRQGLRWLLEDHADIRVVGEAKDGLEAIAMAQELKPDIIIMDVNMPRMNGIEATRQIVLDQPSVIIIGLSFAGDPSVQAAMKNAGANICLNKERAAEEIYQAIVDAVNREPSGKP